jgi:hypothetical protein
MTEGDSQTPAPPSPPHGEVRLSLSPLYTPAKADRAMVVRFVGNTAQIAEVSFGIEGDMVDPFALLAVSEYLRMKALQAIQQGELMEIKRLQRELAQEKAKPRIIKTSKMPPSGFDPGASMGKMG